MRQVAGRRRRGLPVVLRADEGELPRARRRDRGRARSARRRSGRRPRPAARAHPGGHARRRRVGAARRRCWSARTRRPQPGRAAAASQPGGRAAPARADLRDLARDLRELPGAARGDGAASTTWTACCRWSCPRIFRGLGIALVVVLAFATVLGLFVARRATGRVADAARRRPPRRRRRSHACASRRAATTSWTSWGARSTAWSPSWATRARASATCRRCRPGRRSRGGWRTRSRTR